MAALMLEFGVAGRIAPGERISGDLEVVHYYDGGGGALVAAIDGIGHGEQAAATARLGVVGYGELPALHASVIPLRAKDMLIFATDGISRHFSDDLASAASAQSLADAIVAHHCRRSDDALVVVARAS